MKAASVVFFFFLWALPATAAEYSFVAPSVQYEIIPLGNDPVTEREHYGELSEYPVMYEVFAEEPFTLALRLAQPDNGGEPLPLSVLVVRTLSSGRVEQVVRLNAGVWQPVRDRVLGVDWLATEPYATEIPAGTYRIEVSSPTNEGQYQLTLGTMVRPIGYLATWSRISAVHGFLGHSKVALLGSYFVLAHVVVLVLIGLAWRYLWPWWKVRRLSHG